MKDPEAVTPPRPDLSVVLPAYNQGAQLRQNIHTLATFLAGLPWRSEIIIVDDGSSDGSAHRILHLAGDQGNPALRVVQNPSNRGKGYAVRRGVEVAAGAYIVFTDIDLAYPPRDIAAVVAELKGGEHDIVVACRTHPKSRYELSPAFIRYLYTRHQLSRLFNWIVRWWLGLQVRDTQAGLKGFTREAAQEIFGRARIDRFTFDVEILCLGKKLGFRLKEVPVTYRYDSEPSTVQFLEDGIQAILDIIRIRWWLLTGEYNRVRGSEAGLEPRRERRA